MLMSEQFSIREMTETDRSTWARMYREIYPDDHIDGLNAEISRILRSSDRWGFCVQEGVQTLGFAEVSIRPFANGCRSHPVPFLEAIWCDPRYRKAGVARALLDYVEDFVKAHGYSEIGSDVLQENSQGLEVHERFGFEATETVTYFRKSL